MIRGVLAVCALLLTVAACGGEQASRTAGNIDLATAAQYLGEFKSLCDEDAGILWGVSFCGPMLLVDPETRIVVANQADAGGVPTACSRSWI